MHGCTTRSWDVGSVDTAGEVGTRIRIILLTWHCFVIFPYYNKNLKMRARRTLSREGENWWARLEKQSAMAEKMLTNSKWRINSLELFIRSSYWSITKAEDPGPSEHVPELRWSNRLVLLQFRVDRRKIGREPKGDLSEFVQYPQTSEMVEILNNRMLLYRVNYLLSRSTSVWVSACEISGLLRTWNKFHDIRERKAVALRILVSGNDGKQEFYQYLWPGVLQCAD